VSRAGRIARSTWKKVERKVAAFFGCNRTPLSGGASRHTTSDTLHPRLYIEVKHRRQAAAVSLWDRAAAEAKSERKVPIVALGIKNRAGFWLVIRSEDLLEVAMEANLAQDGHVPARTGPLASPVPAEAIDDDLGLEDA